jgi:hypothetical protein
LEAFVFSGQAELQMICSLALRPQHHENYNGKEEERIMKMQDVKKKARMLDMQPSKMKKADLIRAIQSKEGNPTCFDTGKDFCNQTECCWKDDCLPQ